MNWISLYDWALTETMPEDKPDKDVIEDDKRFDSWLEEMERKSKRRAAKAKVMASKMNAEMGNG